MSIVLVCNPVDLLHDFWVSGHCDIPKLWPLCFVFFSFHYPKIYFWPNLSVRDFSLILLFNSIWDGVRRMTVRLNCCTFFPQRSHDIHLSILVFKLCPKCSKSGSRKKNPSHKSLFLNIQRYLSTFTFYLTWPCTCHWCTKHDKSVGYFFIYLIKGKKLMKSHFDWRELVGLG